MAQREGRQPAGQWRPPSRSTWRELRANSVSAPRWLAHSPNDQPINSPLPLILTDQSDMLIPNINKLNKTMSTLTLAGGFFNTFFFLSTFSTGILHFFVEIKFSIKFFSCENAVWKLFNRFCMYASVILYSEDVWIENLLWKWHVCCPHQMLLHREAEDFQTPHLERHTCNSSPCFSFFLKLPTLYVQFGRCETEL